jgi:hypothetical protein
MRQEESWTNDPDQYIADEEDDAISVRVSCEMLVDQIVTVYGTHSLRGASTHHTPTSAELTPTIRRAKMIPGRVRKLPRGP